MALPMTIASLLEPVTGQPGPARLTHAADWMQGRTLYGGASALVAYTMAVRAFRPVASLPEGSARWRSGDAADCKSVYAGSIPARASTPFSDCEPAALSLGRFCRNAALAQSVEHIIRNDGVTCSSHVSGTSLPSQDVPKR